MDEVSANLNETQAGCALEKVGTFTLGIRLLPHGSLPNNARDASIPSLMDTARQYCRQRPLFCPGDEVRQPLTTSTPQRNDSAQGQARHPAR